MIEFTHNILFLFTKRKQFLNLLNFQQVKKLFNSQCVNNLYSVMFHCSFELLETNDDFLIINK